MAPLRILFGEDATVVRERTFRMLFLIAIIIPLGNGLLSPILDSLINPLGASAADIGLMMSFFWVPSVVIVPITGILADKYGRKTVLVPSLVVYGLAGTAIAFTTSFHAALGLRLLQGIGWAGLVPIIVTSIGDLYSGSKETTAQGLRLMGTAMVGGVISLVSGVLVTIVWYYPFYIYATALPVAFLVYAYFEEPTTSDPIVTDGSGSDSYRRRLFILVRKRRVGAIVIARMLPNVVRIGFVTYISIIVVRLLSGTPAQAGVLYAVWSVVSALGASQGGRITQLIRTRYPALLVSHLCLGVGMLTVVFAPHLLVAGMGAIIGAFGSGLSITMYRSLLTEFAPGDLRAGIVSIGATGGRFTGTITPVLIGGALAILTPVVGFTTAMHLAGVGAAIIGGGGGIVCVSIAMKSPHIQPEEL